MKHNMTQQPVPLTIDGVTYSLVFDFNAAAEAEKATGVNLLQASFNLANISSLQLRAFLFAALTSRHPAMTVEDAGDLIRFDTLVDVTTAIVESHSASMPKKKPEAVPADPEATNL
jgi:hypothetical protein